MELERSGPASRATPLTNPATPLGLIYLGTTTLGNTTGIIFGKAESALPLVCALSARGRLAERCAKDFVCFFSPHTNLASFKLSERPQFIEAFIPTIFSKPSV